MLAAHQTASAALRKAPPNAERGERAAQRLTRISLAPHSRPRSSFHFSRAQVLKSLARANNCSLHLGEREIPYPFQQLPAPIPAIQRPAQSKLASRSSLRNQTRPPAVNPKVSNDETLVAHGRIPVPEVLVLPSFHNCDKGSTGAYRLHLPDSNRELSPSPLPKHCPALNHSIRNYLPGLPFPLHLLLVVHFPLDASV